MEEEEKGANVLTVLGIIVLCGMLFYGMWWLIVGSDRSVYEHCMKEYPYKNVGSDAIEEARAFDFCYERIFN